MSIEHLLEYPELCPATFLADHNGWIIAICYLNVHIWGHQNSVSSIYTEKKSCFFPNYIYIYNFGHHNLFIGNIKNGDFKI